MWSYQGAPFTEEQIGNSVGFVYIITNLLTGEKYIGKKLFTKSKIYQKNKKKKKTRAKSDWETYWGSNDVLKEDIKKHGKENFSREILYLCKSKGWLSYMELKEQITRDALIPGNNYYNTWVSVRISKSHLT